MSDSWALGVWHAGNRLGQRYAEAVNNRQNTRSATTFPIDRCFRKHREALGFIQESFADDIGMHRTYYSAIERGEKNLELDTLQKVARGLKKPLWELLREAETSR